MRKDWNVGCFSPFASKLHFKSNFGPSSQALQHQSLLPYPAAEQKPSRFQIRCHLTAWVFVSSSRGVTQGHCLCASSLANWGEPSRSGGDPTLLLSFKPNIYIWLRQLHWSFKKRAKSQRSSRVKFTELNTMWNDQQEQNGIHNRSAGNWSAKVQLNQIKSFKHNKCGD